MSTNIKQLINELCPNGVEWKTLGEITHSIKTGLNPRNNFKLNTPGATNYYVTVKEITTGKILFSDKTDKIDDDALKIIQKRSNLELGDVLFSGIGTIGKVALVDIEPKNWNCSESVFILKPKKDILIPKYLVYILQSNSLTSQFLKQSVGSTLQGVRMSTLSNISIPIPPLPVQEEIVRILDKFTADVNEHIQLLERELELRHKQYEYYRNKLLTPTEENGSWLLNGHSVEWKTLGEVCDVTSGGTPSKSKKEYWENGIIPWLKSEVCNNTSIYSASDFITELGLKNSSTKLLEKNITLMAMVGATRFKTAFLEFEACTNQNIASINSKIKNKLSNKFIFYYLTNKYDEFSKKMSSYGMINLETIRSINIPIPPMEEQERIVGILDKFNKLINDLSIGLPAEIQARKKQYEYYRNKLLTFKEKDS